MMQLGFVISRSSPADFSVYAVLMYVLMMPDFTARMPPAKDAETWNFTGAVCRRGY